MILSDIAVSVYEFFKDETIERDNAMSEAKRAAKRVSSKMKLSYDEVLDDALFVVDRIVKRCEAVQKAKSFEAFKILKFSYSDTEDNLFDLAQKQKKIEDLKVYDIKKLDELITLLNKTSCRKVTLLNANNEKEIIEIIL